MASTRLRSYLLCSALAAALTAGCARQAPVAIEWSPSAALRWVAEQEYSTWEGWRRDGKTPTRPDGVCLGNRAVAAAVGVGGDDLAAITPYFGDAWLSHMPETARWRWTLRRGSLRRQPFGEFPRQRLRRVRGTAIAVGTLTTNGIEITTIDFAPAADLDPNSSNPDLPAIVRLVIVRNTSRYPIDNLWLDLTQPGKHRAEKWGGAIVDVDMNHLLVVCDRHLYLRGHESPVISARLGSLAGGEVAGAAYYLAPGERARRGARQHSLEALRRRAREPLALAEQTARAWRDWSRLPPEIAASPRADERTRDLIDGLLCVIKTRIGDYGLLGGAATGWHAHTPLRDYFCAQRALIAAGKRRDAIFLLKEALARARHLDTETVYHSADGSPQMVNALIADIHYPVLMARFAQRAGWIDGADYYHDIRSCLDRAQVAPDGRQPAAGDEPWLRAMDVDPLDSSLDSMWLPAAAAEYGAYLASQTGRAADAERYAEVARRIRSAIERDFYSRHRRRFVIGLDGRGFADETLAPGTFARGALTGCYPAGDLRIARGLSDGWHRLGYTGGLRAHSRTWVIDGGTSGYALWAAAEAGAPFADDLATRVMRFCSATGLVPELRSACDPAWSSGPGSLLDCSVTALGLLRYVDPAGPASTWQPLRRPRSSAFSRGAGAFLGERKPNCVILHDDSPGHAQLIAGAIARLRAFPVPIESAGGLSPFRTKRNAIVISDYQPSPYVYGGRNYRVVRRAGHWQVWVLNRGDAPADVHGLISDLADWVKPRVAPPEPYPQAREREARKIGRPMAGDTTRIRIEASEPIVMQVGDRRARTTRAEFRPRVGQTREPAASARAPYVSADLRLDGRLATLAVRTELKSTTRVRVAAVLPADYQVIGRGEKARWDPAVESVVARRRDDGQLSLSLHFAPGARRSPTREVTLILAKY